MPHAGNPTPFTLILAPLFVDKQVVGLVEILMDPSRRADGPEPVRRTGAHGVTPRDHAPEESGP